MTDVPDHGKPNDAWEVHALYVVYRWNNGVLEFLNFNAYTYEYSWSKEEAESYVSRNAVLPLIREFGGCVGCTSGMFMKD